MIKLSYTEAAQRDLLSYYQEVSEQTGSAAAETSIEAMMGRCEDLAKFPDMGRRRPELDAFGISVQGITESGRTILYTRRGSTLHVVRVLAAK